MSPATGRNSILSPILRRRLGGWLYGQRAAVERFFNKLKDFRAVTLRYGRRGDTDLAAVKRASVRIWLRFNESVA